MDYVTLISQVGFPIAVTSYLLFRFEKIIQANTEATQALNQIVLNCPYKRNAKR